MVETLQVAVSKLTPGELEPALRRALGMRAYLSGIGKLGGKIQIKGIAGKMIDLVKSFMP